MKTKTKTGIQGNNVGSKSIGKALDVIECVADSGNGKTARELCAQLRLPSSTLFRMLKFLCQNGYLKSLDGNYLLGPCFLRLGKAAGEQNILIRCSRPFLDELAQAIMETVHLAELNGAKVMYLDKVEGRRSIRMGSLVGHSSPLYCTGVGKAMLAFLPKEQRSVILSGLDLSPYTDNTITSVPELEQELEEVHRRGYAIDDCEHENGVFCVAAPVLGEDKNLLAGVSVAGSEIYLRQEQENIASALISCANKIAAALSSRGP